MKTHTETTHRDAGVLAMERTSSTLPAVLAIVFGVFLIVGAGFAQPSTIHNAAHDVRHAFAFPCH